MTEIVLKDVDDVLLDRIGRVARSRGWDLATALMHLLEGGLKVHEDRTGLCFDGSETDVLQAALEALSEIPDDPGFALIGRGTRAGKASQASRGTAPQAG